MSRTPDSSAVAPRGLLQRFGFRQTRRGAIILGLCMGGTIALQGFAFVASYTDAAARAKFAATLVANPAVSFLYGEPVQVNTPSGYMAYRCLAFLSFIGAVWGLMVSTRLLRGQEEEGQADLLLSGHSSLRSSTRQLVWGMLTSLGVAWVLATCIIVLTSLSSKIELSIGHALFFGVTVVLSSVLALAIGALTSQLASTRRQAVTYGLVPLIVLFLLRCVGNVSADLGWIKYFTPFGWIDKIHPTTGPQPLWIVPVLALALICSSLAAYLASGRDVGAGLLPPKAHDRSRLGGLRGTLGLSLRLTWTTSAIWLFGTCLLVGFMSALGKVAASAVADSPSLNDALKTLAQSGTASVQAVFVGMGTLLAAVVLWCLLASGVQALWHEESHSYLDNLLVRPVARARWLLQRLALLCSAITLGSLGAGLVGWSVSRSQGLIVPFGSFVGGSLNMLGALGLALGIGVLLYGLIPRLAGTAVYALLGWSFIAETLASTSAIPSWAINLSLLHHIALIPAAQPDWKTVAVLVVAGLLLMAIGVKAFERRDLQAA